MIARAHSSHLGTNACVRRARDMLFWPCMADQIKDEVQNCEVCNDFLARQQKESLMTHKIPETPWSKVCQDLFTLGDENYLVTVDYYSDYFEPGLPSDTTAESVTNATKRHFARHGIAYMVTDSIPVHILASSPVNGNFSTLPVHHCIAKAMEKLNRQSKSKRIW